MGHRVWDQVVTLNVGFMERLQSNFTTVGDDYFLQFCDFTHSDLRVAQTMLNMGWSYSTG